MIIFLKGDMNLNVIMSIPVTLAVIITVIAPQLTLIALLVVLLTGHRIRFEGKDMQYKQCIKL
jgi:hypothetical protein